MHLFLTQQLLPHLLALYPRLIVILDPLCPSRSIQFLLRSLRSRLFLFFRGNPDYYHPLDSFFSSISPDSQGTQVTGGSRTYSTYPT